MIKSDNFKGHNVNPHLSLSESGFKTMVNGIRVDSQVFHQNYYLNVTQAIWQNPEKCWSCPHNDWHQIQNTL